MAIPYSSPPRATFWQKLGPGGLGSLALALGSGFLLLGAPVLWRLREVLRPVEPDGGDWADLILVLGRKLEANEPSPVFIARLAQAERLWRAGRAPVILIAGGLTAGAQRSEAEAGAAWLQAQGVDPGAILLEDRSQHTLENLFNVREWLRDREWTRTIVISDALHLARVAAFARGLGLPVRCLPAEGCPPAPGSPAWWKRAFWEAFLLHWYHTGMAYSRTLGSKRQLERVT